MLRRYVPGFMCLRCWFCLEAVLGLQIATCYIVSGYTVWMCGLGCRDGDTYDLIVKSRGQLGCLTVGINHRDKWQFPHLPVGNKRLKICWLYCDQTQFVN